MNRRVLSPSEVFWHSCFEMSFYLTGASSRAAYTRDSTDNTTTLVLRNCGIERGKGCLLLTGCEDDIVLRDTLTFPRHLVQYFASIAHEFEDEFEDFLKSGFFSKIRLTWLKL